MPGIPLPGEKKNSRNMQQTSIHIKPVTGDSEAHNLRHKDLPYVRAELSPTNESWQSDSIANRLQIIRQQYEQTTGQRMQKKATPIREGVIVIQESTTMSQLHDFAQQVEAKFGIKTIQIHTHRDEGHTTQQGKFIANNHAHIVFDWTDRNGKSIKLRKQDMAEMQTILADCLQMQRGVSSDIKHLNAVQYKNTREEENAQRIKQEIAQLQTKKAAKEMILSAFKRISVFIGKSAQEKEQNALKTQINAQKTKIDEQQRQINALTGDKEALKRQNKALQDDLQKKKEILATVFTETKALFANLSAQAQEHIGKKYRYLSQCLPKQATPPRQQPQQKKKGLHL